MHKTYSRGHDFPLPPVSIPIDRHEPVSQDGLEEDGGVIRLRVVAALIQDVHHRPWVRHEEPLNVEHMAVAVDSSELVHPFHMLCSWIGGLDIAKVA